MRRLLTQLVLAVLAGSLAGCGASDTVSQSLDPVAAAASKTARLPTTHMSMTATMSVPGLAAPVRMSGEEFYSVHNDTDAEAELLIFSTRLSERRLERQDDFWP